MKKHLSIMIVYSLSFGLGCKERVTSQSTTKTVDGSYQKQNWYKDLKNRFPNKAGQFDSMISTLNSTSDRWNFTYFKWHKKSNSTTEISREEMYDRSLEEFTYFKIKKDSPFAYRSFVRDGPGNFPVLVINRYSMKNLQRKIDSRPLNFNFGNDPEIFAKNLMEETQKYNSFITQEFANDKSITQNDDVMFTSPGRFIASFLLADVTFYILAKLVPISGRIVGAKWTLIGFAVVLVGIAYFLVNQYIKSGRRYKREQLPPELEAFLIKTYKVGADK